MLIEFKYSLFCSLSILINPLLIFIILFISSIKFLNDILAVFIDFNSSSKELFIITFASFYLGNTKIGFFSIVLFRLFKGVIEILYFPEITSFFIFFEIAIMS